MSCSSKGEPSLARREVNAHHPAQPVSSHAGSVTVPQEWPVLQPGLRNWQRVSAAAKAEQHPSMSWTQRQRCVLAPGIPMEPGQTHAQTNELSPSRCQSPGSTSTAFQAGSAPSTPTPYADPDGMSQGSWCEVAPSLTHTHAHQLCLAPDISPPLTHVRHRVPWSTHTVCTSQFRQSPHYLQSGLCHSHPR